jgi:hypothetical protein
LKESNVRDIEGDNKRTPVIQAHIDEQNFDITLKYKLSEQSKEWKEMIFTKERITKEGFYIYSTDVDSGVKQEEDYVRKKLKTCLPASIYHHFKEFFHEHRSHSHEEDALLDNKLHAYEDFSWDAHRSRERAIKPVVEYYLEKINLYIAEWKWWCGSRQYAPEMTKKKRRKKLEKDIENARSLQKEMEYFHCFLKLLAKDILPSKAKECNKEISRLDNCIRDLSERKEKLSSQKNEIRSIRVAVASTILTFLLTIAIFFYQCRSSAQSERRNLLHQDSLQQDLIWQLQRMERQQDSLHLDLHRHDAAERDSLLLKLREQKPQKSRP